jgi:hypothetical protein
MTPTEAMIEAAARAMCESEWKDPAAWDGAAKSDHKYWIDCATVALTAALSASDMVMAPSDEALDQLYNRAWIKANRTSDEAGRARNIAARRALYDAGRSDTLSASQPDRGGA